jgi:hypothetical protein
VPGTKLAVEGETDDDHPVDLRFRTGSNLRSQSDELGIDYRLELDAVLAARAPIFSVGRALNGR